MSSVRLVDISKRYNGRERPAVFRLNLEIFDGEFVVLVGPSGCGKTTTLRIIAGLEEATSGDVFIGERRVNDVPPRDRDVAMVFQHYALYPHMTVRENLSFGLRLRKVPRDEITRRVEETAQLLGIAEYLDERPASLSGGQRQRVALGRAIVRKANVFLFDEPLSNLDAKLRVQMRSEIKKLHQRLASTMIYVTHDQVEAMTMGDRIAVMKDGLIHQVDTPINLYEQPSDLFVAGFIGTPAMNTIPAVIEEKTGALVIDGDIRVIPPEIHFAPFYRFAGSPFFIGIRPEHVHLSPDSCQEPFAFEATHEISEFLGNEALAVFRLNVTNIVVRMGVPRTFHDNERVRLFLDMAHAVWFDGHTERNISL
ncbi:MAG: sn-glycerol-3-phosphate ABC transporter ATP-binding protein UgpC [Bacteroidota bacterium]|nr:sn-glycerol-3-phosphate ABC transporter ATP-binding protein UgpC [Bacteroidota bacterium]